MTAIATTKGTAGASWTPEQRAGIDQRDGDLLLAAGAGSGKTSVLVERFVRSVVDDGVGVSDILTITFTEKAAAEMRDRIRLRLRQLGHEEAARATEGAFIATIHGFCARLLRAHALAAGVDPAFSVLDELQARGLADRAFADAAEQVAERDPQAVDLIAAYGMAALRAAIISVYHELRCRGAAPVLPPLGAPPELAPAVQRLRQAAADAAAHLGAVARPGVRVIEALQRLAHCQQLGGARALWPGELDALALPKGNGAVLSTPACHAYSDALAAFGHACEMHYAVGVHGQLDALLRAFAHHYDVRKRERGALDFEDLELLTRQLLVRDGDLRDRYRARFARIMVDELQDTNSVQLSLIGVLADGNLFTVGDAQQSIYGFRHADVELFERLATERRADGRYATLRINFRSRPEILEVVNAAFAGELDGGFSPLRPGRGDGRAPDPRVELLVVDKGADYQEEGLAAPWRRAEARALAARVAQLRDGGVSAGHIVVLTRATTDLRTYEIALEERRVPTYVIGGRGYWSHPQVIDLVAYLRALANPADQEALYTVLASPLVGVSLDALVLVAAAAQQGQGEPWTLLCEHAAAPGGGRGVLEALGEDDRRRLVAFAGWFAGEREAMAHSAVEQLIDRVLELTGYDLQVLREPGGRRRLANVRKLMRLAREHETAHGPGLRAFLELVSERAGGGDARESEAPVEGESLDAVRLMTIHRAKGLEFDVVCVADLGRVRRGSSELLRVGADGRLGLRLARPGSGKAVAALDYQQLGEERTAAEAAEERRLFYVAMTRARERLLLSGAAKLEGWPEGNGGTAISWVAPALIPDFAGCVATGQGVSERGVAWTVLREPPAEPGRSSEPPAEPGHSSEPPAEPGRSSEPPAEPDLSSGDLSSFGARELWRPLASSPSPGPTTLSYTSLSAYRRCGYRFYVEQVLGVPELRGGGDQAGTEHGQGLSAAQRGVAVHALLEDLDFARPAELSSEAIARACRSRGLPSPGGNDMSEIAALVGAFATSPLCSRLARATHVGREQRFSFLLDGGLMMTGALDVLARERANMLVVDYKSDRLSNRSPGDLLEEHYGEQRSIYALAVLLTGAPRVEVAHVFLERAHEPVCQAFTRADTPALKAALRELTDGVRRGEFEVAAHPHRGLCDGCPAEGGLCSWPPEVTRRRTPL